MHMIMVSTKKNSAIYPTEKMTSNMFFGMLRGVAWKEKMMSLGCANDLLRAVFNGEKSKYLKESTREEHPA
ncbi:TMhelix containing protein [Caenorhabditis elegans]|uniref:TMhelix containing protein n=1 Tax=Caenorhabditis elegans TaxID=6239 RepID=O17115_CAEEL|nr:TMhelix containing protein [Caenorhabditis elegans]CCD68916.2 TMhelix containing protein [Caenorhabditis elegans]|eukprot:NP_494503.2 Uncharacterized protein CELE_F39E9.6 [Caenorhabditis elegans]